MTTHAQRIAEVEQDYDFAASALDAARREVVTRLASEIASLRDALAERDELIAAQADQIARLRHQVRELEQDYGNACTALRHGG